MAGRICGLDHAGCLTCLPPDLDRALAITLLAAAETGLLEGLPQDDS